MGTCKTHHKLVIRTVLFECPPLCFHTFTHTLSGIYRFQRCLPLYIHTRMDSAVPTALFASAVPMFIACCTQAHAFTKHGCLQPPLPELSTADSARGWWHGGDSVVPCKCFQKFARFHGNSPTLPEGLAERADAASGDDVPLARCLPS